MWRWRLNARIFVAPEEMPHAGRRASHSNYNRIKMTPLYATKVQGHESMPLHKDKIANKSNLI